MADAATGDIQELLEEGLRLYSAGQPARALELWYRVLDQEPRHPTALEYVQFVRENFHVDVREPRPVFPLTESGVTPAAVPEPVSAAVAPAAVAPVAETPAVPEPVAATAPEVPVEPGEPVDPDEPLELMAPPILRRQEAASAPSAPSAPAVVEPAVAPAPVSVEPAAEPASVSVVAEGAPPVASAASVASVASVAPTAPAASVAPVAPVGAGWGDLAVGDLDLDPLTGRPVQRAAAKAEAAPASSASNGVATSATTREPEGQPEAQPDPQPDGQASGQPEEPPEIPLVMAPLPVSLEPAIADAVPSGAPSEESAGEPAAPVAVATAAAEPANPWDGHSGITEAVDLDNALGQPSAMDVLLAGPVRRPHVENGLRGEPDVAAPAPAAAVESPAEPQSELSALMDGARDLFELGDFSGSLELVEKVLRQDPNNAEAHAYLARNESTLLKMYESKLGDLRASPRVLTSPDEVIWMNLHHRAGFVLSQVDGELTYEDIVEVSGMSRFETFRILAELVENGVIG